MIALDPDLELRATAARVQRQAQAIFAAAHPMPQGAARRRQYEIGFTLEKAARALANAATLMGDADA